MDNKSEKVLKLEAQVQEMTSEIASDVFRKARETKGSERLLWVKKLKKFGSIVGPEKYAEILRNLITNEDTINELERMGREELAQQNKTKIKKLFSK